MNKYLKRSLVVGASALMLFTTGLVANNHTNTPVHADAFEYAMKHNPKALKAFIEKGNKQNAEVNERYDLHMYGGKKGLAEHVKEVNALKNSISNDDNNTNTNSDNNSQSNSSDVQNDTDNSGKYQAEDANLQKQENGINSIDNELKNESNKMLKAEHHSHKRSNHTKRAKVNHHKSYRKAKRSRKAKVNRNKKAKSKVTKRSRKARKNNKRNRKNRQKKVSQKQLKAQLRANRKQLRRYQRALKRSHKWSSKRYYAKLVKKLNNQNKHLNKLIK